MYCLKKERKKILVLFFAIPFLLGMAIDLYVPSLPYIANYYKVSPSLVKFTISFYMLGYGFGQMFLGIISDSLGRKKILIFCSILFTIFSLLAVFSKSIYYLNFFRLMQGLSVAGLGVIGRAMSKDCFSGLALNRVITYISTSWALGPIVGPFIGGYLQQYFNWQMNFYFFVAYGILLTIYIFFIKETHFDLHPLKLGIILKNVKKIITYPFFMLSSFLLVFIYSMIVVFNVVGPFLIQNILKYSAVDYGHFALFLGMGYFLGNFSNQFFIKYFKPRNLTFFGIFTALFMSSILSSVSFMGFLNITVIIYPIFFIFIALGFIFPNIMSEIMELFPKISGTVSAIYGTIVILGVSFITFLVSFMKTNTQIPLSVLYVGFMAVSLILFLISIKIDKLAS
ncbi:MAG: multidrug effflux MFS transporter [Parachlamydiales bacterium]|nr:multidrug effflux MFS transporter [Parachlamydiales bacterium]